MLVLRRHLSPSRHVLLARPFSNSVFFGQPQQQYKQQPAGYRNANRNGNFQPDNAMDEVLGDEIPNEAAGMQSEQALSFKQSTMRPWTKPAEQALSGSIDSQRDTSSVAPFPEEAEQSYNVTSYIGLSGGPFEESVARILSEPLNPEDIEVKADGSLYLPEIRYRKILIRAFGAGGWSLIPRGPHTFSSGTLSREYALFCAARFVSQARGHAQITNSTQTPASVSETARSNALMRCCKDLGIANELWDQHYVSKWKAQFAFRKNDPSGRSRPIWVKKDV